MIAAARREKDGKEVFRLMKLRPHLQTEQEVLAAAAEQEGGAGSSSSHLLLRTPSLQVGEMFGVSSRDARDAIDAAGGNMVAAGKMLLSQVNELWGGCTCRSGGCRHWRLTGSFYTSLYCCFCFSSPLSDRHCCRPRRRNRRAATGVRSLPRGPGRSGAAAHGGVRPRGLRSVPYVADSNGSRRQDAARGALLRVRKGGGERSVGRWWRGEGRRRQECFSE